MCFTPGSPYRIERMDIVQFINPFHNKLPGPDVKTVMLRACPTLYGVSAQLPCCRYLNGARGDPERVMDRKVILDQGSDEG